VNTDGAVGQVQSTGKLGDGKARSAVDIISYPNVRLCDIVQVMINYERETRAQDQRERDEGCGSGDDSGSGELLLGEREFEELEFLLLGSKDFNSLQYNSIEAACKYFHYTENQAVEMAKWSKRSSVKIPASVVYDRSTFPSLSGEELEKLSRFKPETLDQAAQLEGITPGAVVQMHRALAKMK
jgi:tRNA U34 5-carboxymethylaminomethyl modifying enzyme MnmG/GidA